MRSFMSELNKSFHDRTSLKTKINWHLNRICTDNFKRSLVFEVLCFECSTSFKFIHSKV